MEKLELWKAQWESQGHWPKWWGWTLYPELIPNPVFPATMHLRMLNLYISGETYHPPELNIEDPKQVPHLTILDVGYVWLLYDQLP